jgi:hypothetical protein
MRVITNNVPRPVIDGWELSPDERQNFDYIDWAAIERCDAESASFFRYRGTLYDLGEFMATRGLRAPLSDWDGYMSDSAFSAVVVRYADDTDYVVVGLVLS